MVTLSQVHASNALISSLPNLVAVFIGATSGIGEYFLKAFTSHAVTPRVYIVGRSQASGDRLVSECKKLNPTGSFNFIKCEVSLLNAVDTACEEIRRREKTLNILFNSAGGFSAEKTPEGFPEVTALVYYSRTRFILNLLPLLRFPSPHPTLRRVLSVFTGGKEGAVDVSDFPGGRISNWLAGRAHLSSMVTLSLSQLALQAPEVSFIHNFPGTIQTPILDDMPGFKWQAARLVNQVFGSLWCMPGGECGERHLYLMTSERFGDGGVKWQGKRVEGINGMEGSGVYSITQEGESTGPEVVEVLNGLRKEGVQGKLWKHTMEQLVRVTGKEHI